MRVFTAPFFIFYKVNNYYLLIGRPCHEGNRQYNDSETKIFFFHIESLSLIYNNDIIQPIFLKKTFGLEIDFTEGEYFIVRKNNYISIIDCKIKEQLAFESYIDKAIAEFRLYKKNKLIDCLFLHKNTLEDYISYFCNYVFCDNYSLWIYNRYTDVFTCNVAKNISSYKKKYIRRDDHTLLFNFLESTGDLESREPNKKCLNYKLFKDMKTLNRIKLDLGGKMYGILSFYSYLPGFSIKKDIADEIKHSLETKYFEENSRQQVSIRNIVETFKSYQSGRIDDFMYEIVNCICNQLYFETCSIFLKDSNGDLVLKATRDKFHTGEPPEKIVYKLNEKSFTSLVYNEKKTEFSYDIENDKRNSHKYDEKPENISYNWIGMPIQDENSIYGVLRVKNKFYYCNNKEKKNDNFHVNDFVGLETVCSHLSAILNIESVYQENLKKLRDTKLKLDQLNDFNRVFLHEIRTPISKFSTAPEIIKKMVEKNSNNDHKDAMVRRLEDIQVMGERLGFLVKTYYFDNMLEKSDFKRLTILEDIVMPVLNITRDYMKKNFNLNIKYDLEMLRAIAVYGDKDLLNMAFHVLIDNAGKYTTGVRPIYISGKYNQKYDFFYLTVSNDGFLIGEDEVEEIFKKGGRGKAAKEKKRDGTGIGLFLARKIMEKHNGSIELISHHNPVTFQLKIPTKKF